MPAEAQRIRLFAEVQGVNPHADDGRCRRCERRARHAHFQWEHQHPIHNDIEQAGCHRRGHGKRRIAVVEDEGAQDVVAHEEGREEQENACIRRADRHDVRFAAKQPHDALRAENAQQDERHGQNSRPCEGFRKIAVGVFSFAPLQGEAGRRAGRQHRAQGKNQRINGQDKVQGGDAVRPLRLCDKEGVGEDIGGDANHAEDVLRNVAEELLPHGGMLVHSGLLLLLCSGQHSYCKGENHLRQGKIARIVPVDYPNDEKCGIMERIPIMLFPDAS